jgi:hypothetical protein
VSGVRYQFTYQFTFILLAPPPTDVLSHSLAMQEILVRLDVCFTALCINLNYSEHLTTMILSPLSFTSQDVSVPSTGAISHYYYGHCLQLV